MLNYSDELTLERAEYRLTSACMAERGFKYDPPAVGGNPPESSNDSNMPRRYGISDPEESARLGYHTRSSQRPSDTVAPISEAERTALLGVGKPGKTTGGCVAESRKKLQITFGTKASELNRASLDTSLESPEIQDLMRQWSDCMKSRGYSYADVYAPLGQFNQSSNSGIGEAERQTAAVDIECKKKTGMVEKWFAKEVAIQNQLIEQNQLSLTKEKEDLERAIKNSADLH
ncbi:hypothetical protein AB0O31_07945 [Kitasatospora cineracea]|uniref:hypothetical protein n=1 Tax=Kitasatospora cineracea TaxID=88074 RepID=UPI00342FF740